ncbi:MAG: bifunctional DNA-formamidopyrimidine glycosylase/DNA-(apurinic or apyrimidinic site) lyase [Phycisphaerales bacterium]
MPELPEVETVRRTLEARVVGRRVTSATLKRRDVLVMPGDPAGGFSRARGEGRVEYGRVRQRDLLAGDVLGEVIRHGKQLAIVGDSGRVVCVHLGMSGNLIWRAPRARLEHAGHVHTVWRLDDGSRLVFRDPRRFGGLWAFPSLEALWASRWDALGPDAIRVRAPQLQRALARTDRAVKAALLDQSVVAGVGNIYADEALFGAGVDPRRPGASLTPAECASLARQIRGVLARAVTARGSTLRDYRDANGDSGAYQLAHSVYGRGGEPCPKCGGALASALVAQRTTVWCPSCQA